MLGKLKIATDPLTDETAKTITLEQGQTLIKKQGELNPFEVLEALAIICNHLKTFYVSLLFTNIKRQLPEHNYRVIMEFLNHAPYNDKVKNEFKTKTWENIKKSLAKPMTLEQELQGIQKNK